jgi:hypothetical protein
VNGAIENLNRARYRMAQTVKELYVDLLKQGMPPKDAAKEAQSRTGHSLVTGQPMRVQPDLNKFAGVKKYGQYPIVK